MPGGEVEVLGGRWVVDGGKIRSGLGVMHRCEMWSMEHELQNAVRACAFSLQSHMLR